MRSLSLIIFDPVKDDFLAVIQNHKHGIYRSWCSHPSSAKVFKKKQLAINVIRQTIANTDRVLLLAEFSDFGKQYAVSFLFHFSFENGKLIEFELEQKYTD